MPRRQLDAQLATNEFFALAAELDKVLNRAHLEAVVLAEFAQLRHPRHAAVGLQNLADDCRGLKARQPRQIRASFRVAGSHEYAARLGSEPIHVAWANKIV